jgi:hypothetical protein
VDLESDEVAEPVDEVLEVPGPVQRPLGQLLQVGHRDPGLDHREDVLLRLGHGTIGAGLPGRGLSGEDTGCDERDAIGVLGRLHRAAVGPPAPPPTVPVSKNFPS